MNNNSNLLLESVRDTMPTGIGKMITKIVTSKTHTLQNAKLFGNFIVEINLIMTQKKINIPAPEVKIVSSGERKTVIPVVTKVVSSGERKTFMVEVTTPKKNRTKRIKAKVTKVSNGERHLIPVKKAARSKK